MSAKTELEKRVARAVRHFWKTRTRQGNRQGRTSGRRDQGNRTAATGGKQLNGFTNLIVELLREAGLPEDTIYVHGKADITLPGFFRPTKQWDVVVVARSKLLASIECKALCGPSFGNNYNNRVEEAIGSATDIWTAFREGAFDTSPRPFVGYVLLLEDSVASKRAIAVCERHFAVEKAYQNASYALRCEESLRRLIRERCYDAASLVLTKRTGGVRGQFSEPADDLNFYRFSTLMSTHVSSSYRVITKS